MPEAIVAIVIIGIISGTLLGLTGMILKHRQNTRALGSGGADQGIRMSELRQMMREAAAEAVAPLEARVEELQATVEDLPDRGGRLLEEPAGELLELDEADESEESVRVRRRVK